MSLWNRGGVEEGPAGSGCNFERSPVIFYNQGPAEKNQSKSGWKFLIKVWWNFFKQGAIENLKSKLDWSANDFQSRSWSRWKIFKRGHGVDENFAIMVWLIGSSFSIKMWLKKYCGFTSENGVFPDWFLRLIARKRDRDWKMKIKVRLICERFSNTITIAIEIFLAEEWDRLKI